MAVRERHEAAFHEFVAVRSSRLFRTALLMVGDYQLAQDLLQESLVKTYAAWPRLRDVGNAEAYTRRVIVTTSTSWRRRNSFHERPAEALPDGVVADMADLIAADADLWTHLHALPSRQRAAVVLRYCQDLSEVQTAELMACTVGSVKRHASRGLAKLRARMGAQLDLPSADESEVTS
ncbi:MAG TPA: SigE family RNA polymerase sigma factor [Actinomycetes bacterium]